MSSVPRVSVIIPLFEQRAWIGAALQSVLAQGLAPDALEVIVVDDGSTDDGGRVAEGFAPAVRCIRQANRGLPAARNVGLRASRGSAVMFLDADDRLLPGALKALLTVTDEQPEVAVVVGQWHCVDERGTRLPQGSWRPAGNPLARLLVGESFPIHAAMIRRVALVRAGEFDETLTALEDWDLWLRIARLGVPWSGVEHPVAEYRIRGGSMHDDGGRMLSNRLAVLDRFFADPTVPDEVWALRPDAEESALLAGACDAYRVGDRPTGLSRLREAVRRRPGLLTEPRTLRRLCRLLLPVGSQADAAVAADWRRLTTVVRSMLADLFAIPDLEPAIRRLRHRALLAYWRTVARSFRKAALHAPVD